MARHTLADLVKDLAADIRDIDSSNRIVMTLIGSETVEQARQLIGHSQNMWAPLADSTIQIKTKLGLGLNGDPSSPLYSSGEFYDDISFELMPRGVMIGTNKDYIKYTEYGTSKMPPRPVFPMALYKTWLEVSNQIPFFYLHRLSGKRIIKPVKGNI